MSVVDPGSPTAVVGCRYSRFTDKIRAVLQIGEDHHRTPRGPGCGFISTIHVPGVRELRAFCAWGFVWWPGVAPWLFGLFFGSDGVGRGRFQPPGPLKRAQLMTNNPPHNLPQVWYQLGPVSPRRPGTGGAWRVSSLMRRSCRA